MEISLPLTSILAICFCLAAYFFVTESPRWLVIQGREEEAMAVLKEANTTEGGGDLASSLLEDPAKANPKASILGFYSSVAVLFQKRWAVQRILAVIVLGFGTGMEYYGMSLGVGNLSFNIYFECYV
ncbi:hypothetical protein L6164_022894 [Bauhinia variegata]|uniref:Uncharacterized protein n=1 Tax=Bauhinia variegata TaxID=167791 RepID=A0ACB9MIG4_BAUVA|nr:hypothetical protein L6164_022894 [Bauhinia variegata]